MRKQTEAFPWKKFLPLEMAIDDLYRRAAAHYPIGVSYDEYLRMFLTPEDINVVHRSYALLNTNYGRDASFTLGGHRISTNVYGQNRHYPKESALRLQNPQAENVLRIIANMEELKVWGKKLGIAKQAMRELNRICDKPQQMRFIWPSLVALLNMSPALAAEAEELQRFKVPKEIPHVPQLLSIHLKDAAGTIASAQMFGDAPETHFEVPFKLHSQQVRVDGLGGVSCLT